jgi:hypothetical protein
MISYGLFISGDIGSKLDTTIQHRCEVVAMFQLGIADLPLPLSPIASGHRSAETVDHFLLLVLIFDFYYKKRLDRSIFHHFRNFFPCIIGYTAPSRRIVGWSIVSSSQEFRVLF